MDDVAARPSLSGSSALEFFRSSCFAAVVGRLCQSDRLAGRLFSMMKECQGYLSIAEIQRKSITKEIP